MCDVDKLLMNNKKGQWWVFWTEKEEKLFLDFGEASLIDEFCINFFKGKAVILET